MHMKVVVILAAPVFLVELPRGLLRPVSPLERNQRLYVGALALHILAWVRRQHILVVVWEDHLTVHFLS